MNEPLRISEKQALSHLMDLLAIEGPSGREAAVSRAIEVKLRAAGCKKSWIRRDDVYKRIPADFETGKSVADHGISLVLNKDCALLRGFKGDICIAPDPGADFAASLAFATDPMMAPRESGQAPDIWLAELRYLSDSLGPAG